MGKVIFDNGAFTNVEKADTHLAECYDIESLCITPSAPMVAKIRLTIEELDAIHAAIHADDEPEAEPEADCCGNCFYADMIEFPAGSHGEDTVESPLCRRFPESIMKDGFDWCGEYRPKE